MKAGILIALIAAFPPTLAAVLGYLASSRSLRRTVGVAQDLPLTHVVDRLEVQIQEVHHTTSEIAQRLARLEGASSLHGGTHHAVQQLAAELSNVSQRVARLDVSGGPRSVS